MDIGPHFRPDIGMYFGVILKVIIKYNIKLISFYDIIFCEWKIGCMPYRMWMNFDVIKTRSIHLFLDCHKEVTIVIAYKSYASTRDL